VAVQRCLAHFLLEPAAREIVALIPPRREIMAVMAMLEVVATSMQRAVAAGVLAALA
jgi:hypothetical protein